MARELNIEVLRLVKTKRTALVLAICALAFACLLTAMPGSQAKYASADSGRHVFVFSDTNDVAISVTETWSELDGKGLRSGSTVVKQPVIKNQKSDVYMRAIIRITDGTSEDVSGKVLDPQTDARRISLILGTLYSDPNGSLNAGSSYSRHQLDSLDGVKDIYNMTAFNAPVYNEQMQAYTLDYKGKFANGASVALFDKVAVPSDYTVEEVKLMGDYTITVWAQAIQTKGFSNAEDALNALSDKYSAYEIKSGN